MLPPGGKIPVFVFLSLSLSLSLARSLSLSLSLLCKLPGELAHCIANTRLIRHVRIRERILEIRLQSIVQFPVHRDPRFIDRSGFGF